MASGALFGGSTSARSTSKNLLEFRAGRMDLKNKMVHPDKKKGLLYLHQSEDGLMHFCWKERSKSKADEDYIIFPDDCEFKRVQKCTTGRVYVLKFKSTGRVCFYWLQEPKTDKDEENCRKLNDYLNNPPTQSPRGGGNGGGGIPPELAASLGGDSDLQNLLSGMSQQQLMQLFSGMGGGLGSLLGGRSSSTLSDSNPPSRIQSTPGTRESTSTDISQASTPRTVTAGAALPSQPGRTDNSKSEAGGNTGRIQLSDLQNILSGFGGAGSEPAEVDLSESLNGELLIPLLAKPELQERLTPFLPQGESLPTSEEELKQTIHSPQFKQAVRGFCSAFSSGQLGPLMAQFGLSQAAVDAANAGDMDAFSKALEADKKKEEPKQEEKMEQDN